MPVAPLAVEYKPPPHLEHSYRFVALSYKPGEHALQESWAAVCWKPALHQQCSMRLLPATDVELPGHAAHAPACTASTVMPYVPPPQRAQAPAPAAAYVPATQAEQAPALDAPEAVENFPAAQSAHTCAPAALNFPATQSRQ